ncbi:MAG TPA: universal stress protein [Sulfuricella sp.]|nr:universal stress protein [Sulfuricella sp.]
MHRNILVAVDGSKISDLALREAIDLAKDLHGTLHIVHVVDEVIFNWDGEFGGIFEVLESFRGAGQRVLEQAQIQARNAGLEAEGKLLEIQTVGHRIADLIVEEAKNWPADLIVLGSHGRRGLHDLLLGSVADGVMRSATVPVLLVR